MAKTKWPDHPISINSLGQPCWYHQPTDKYEVTGVQYRTGKRFKINCPTWKHAEGINLWRGTKWLVRDGKRYIIVRVWNP